LLVDGWSWPRIFAELSALYRAGGAAALDPPCQYKEYIRWLRRKDTQEDDLFWRRTLDGVVEPTPLPIGPVRPDSAAASQEISRLLMAETTTALGALARAHQVTLGSIVGAAWSLVLAHHSGRSDVVFGASFAGRPPEIAGVDTMIGPCVNNLPVRVLVDEHETVGEWLRRVHDRIGELTHYQTTPVPR